MSYLLPLPWKLYQRVKRVLSKPEIRFRLLVETLIVCVFAFGSLPATGETGWRSEGRSAAVSVVSEAVGGMFESETLGVFMLAAVKGISTNSAAVETFATVLVCQPECAMHALSDVEVITESNGAAHLTGNSPDLGPLQISFAPKSVDPAFFSRYTWTTKTACLGTADTRTVFLEMITATVSELPSAGAWSNEGYGFLQGATVSGTGITIRTAVVDHTMGWEGESCG